MDCMHGIQNTASVAVERRALAPRAVAVVVRQSGRGRAKTQQPPIAQAYQETSGSAVLDREVAVIALACKKVAQAIADGEILKRLLAGVQVQQCCSE